MNSHVLQKFHTLIITGASSGIGKSFLEHAFKMEPRLKIFNLSRRVPEGIFTTDTKLAFKHIGCDLAVREQTDAAAAQLLLELQAQGPEAGPILLLNNSGFGSYGEFPDPSLERNLDMIDVNVRAPVLLTGRLLPLLRARGGAVINVASTAAFQPCATMATYGASKAFVLHWSLALREELRGSGVHVLALCPGPTSTQFFRNAGMDNAFLPDVVGQETDEVIEATLRALAAERGMVVSGWKNKVSSFLASKLPKVLAARLAAKVIAHFRPTPGKAGAK